MDIAKERKKRGTLHNLDIATTIPGPNIQCLAADARRLRLLREVEQRSLQSLDSFSACGKNLSHSFLRIAWSLNVAGLQTVEP